MSLSLSSLEGELLSIYSQANSALATAKKTAIAIANFWQGGVSNLSGVPQSSAIIS